MRYRKVPGFRRRRKDSRPGRSRLLAGRITVKVPLRHTNTPLLVKTSMHKARWPILLLTPALLLACSGTSSTEQPVTPDSPTLAEAPRLTVSMLRDAERQRLANDTVESQLARHLAPSRGDVIGFGGSLLGDVAAGLPGGAALGFGGQVAGGNSLVKAVGSTVGALLGSVLGPIGSIVGSVAGGFAGRGLQGEADSVADPGPIYIDGMDTGPVAAVIPAAVRTSADKT